MLRLRASSNALGVSTLFLVLASLAPAQTLPVVTDAVLRPAAVPAGIATPVTVLASIDDARTIANSVVIQRLSATGAAVGTFGSMRDDGVAPDATANDKVFTGRIQVYETSPGALNLRVSAAFTGMSTRVNSSTLTLSITGQTPITIQIASPLNSAYVNLSPIAVTGTIGQASATVQVNGINAVMNGTSFTASVPLIEGSNIITAVATANTGATATASTNVTFDTTPPRVTVQTPLPNIITSQATIAVSGIVNDIVVGTVNEQQATVTVNGLNATVNNRTFLAPSVPLTVGPNVITAIARDRAGNTFSAIVNVTRQAATPGQPQLQLRTGNNQTGAVGAQVVNPLVVRLLSGSNQPLANRQVTFRVTENNGLVNNNPAVIMNTNMLGDAEVRLTLGSRAGAGNNAVEVTAEGVTGAIVFRASATSGAAGRIVVDSGLNQTGVIGQPLPFPFVAIVTDAQHNRLRNVPVRFTAIQGGGKLNGQTFIDTMSDSDGRVSTTLTLGNEEGQGNNIVEARITNVAGVIPVQFNATALAPGRPEDTVISGVVLDNSDRPIPNVTIRLLRLGQAVNNVQPVQIAPSVMTDASGAFRITNAPIGAMKLMADGSTSAPVGGWPTLEYDLVTVAGRNNTVGSPIYLPALDRVNRLCVTETTGGTLTLPQAPGFALTVAPGSATFPGGSRTGCISVTPVNPDKVPMAPGFGQQPRFVVTIQPVGTQFNPPAQITIPNVDGLLPRAKTEMYSYDHDLASFVAIGTGSVSIDGTTIASDPGVGVIKAGWHCGGNPNPAGSAGTCPTCQTCQGGSCVPQAGGCNDNNACTRDDRCVNGSCTGTPIDTSTWTERVIGGGDYRLPDGVKGKFEAALRAIGINIQLREIRVGAQGRQKNCCGPDTGVQEGGLVEEQATIQFVVSLQRIPIPGLSTPSIRRELDLTVVLFTVDFQVGASADINFRLNGSVGRRIDACNPGNNCTYGEVNGSIDFDPGFTIEAIGCVGTYWTSTRCGGVTLRPLALRISIRGGVRYNKPDCNSGIDGFVTLARVALRVELNLDIPARPTRAVFEVELYGGGEF